MENNGIQPPQPMTPTQPGMDAQQSSAPAANTGWPSAAPPPAMGVGSGAPAPGVAPAVTPTPVVASSPTPAPVPTPAPAPAPGMAAAPASWGAPAAPAAPAQPFAPSTQPANVPAPATPDLSAAPTPAPAEVAVAPDAAVDPQNQEKPADDHNPMAIPTDTKAKRKMPIGVIIGAIVVALLLAGVAVFAYMKMQNKATSQKAIVPAIHAADVDKTQTEIDQSLTGVDDTKDFAQADLSDSALGL